MYFLYCTDLIVTLAFDAVSLPCRCRVKQHLLITLGAYEHDHSFAFEVGYIVGFSILGEVGSESSEQEFTLLFEDDRASAEEDVGFDFVAFFEELDSMLEFEVVVVIIGLRTETDLFHFLLLRIRLRLFLFFLLRVQELLVVHHSANGRVSRSSYLDQIEILLIGNSHCLLKRVDTLFYIVADKAHLCHTANLIIDSMRVFFNNATTTWSGSNSCYILSY